MGEKIWLKILPLLVVNKKKFLFNIIELKRINQKLSNVIRFLQIIVFLKKSHLNKLKYIYIFQEKIETKENKEKEIRKQQ